LPFEKPELLQSTKLLKSQSHVHIWKQF